MSQQQQPSIAQKEARIQLAKCALERGQIQSGRNAAKTYEASETTLRRRRAGIKPRRDCTPNSRILTDLEECVIVQNILDLVSHGTPPSLRVVGDMANQLLAARGTRRVGEKWPRNFVSRHPELETRFNRKYDYQRAKNEDPTVIGDWFRLVRNTKDKYGILDDDTYNFDEIGFMMGVISTELVVTASEIRNRPKSIQPGNREWVTVIHAINALGWAIPPFIIFAGQHHLQAWYEGDDIPGDWPISLSDNGWTTDELGFEWLKHFNKHTESKTKGTRRLLIIDGHGSHTTLKFIDFCKEHNIVTLCMPSHSSHLLQPLDVGCFAPLKRAYGKQVEDLMRNSINHITKLEFLPAFRAAFNVSIIPDNIRGAFRGAGLIPFNPDTVISKLNIKFKTPTPPPAEDLPWESKTPSNAVELASQTELIRNRIQQHQGSSPTSILYSLDQLAKSAKTMMHSVTLLNSQVASLKKANEAATRRKQRQKKRIQKRGTLTKDEGSQLINQANVDAQIVQEMRQSLSRRGGGAPAQRRCGRCREVGHRIETCPLREADTIEVRS
jgi:DDE superfamily endonuclease